MTQNRITIGRDSRCDVHIDERWDTVSNQHADIERQGDMLLFYDHSSNGTVINGQKIHNTTVSIYPGDKILLAGVFELTWEVINRYFPYHNRPTVTRNIHGENSAESGRKTVQWNTRPSDEDRYRRADSGRKTEPFNYEVNPPQRPASSQNRSDSYGQANAYSQADIDKALEKWNWGAFFCSWLWAVVHKIYWPLLILVVGCIPYIGQVCSLCLCVYLGLKGSKLGWESGIYKDFESYERIQRKWAIGGLIWFILSVIVSAYGVFVTLSML